MLKGRDIKKLLDAGYNFYRLDGTKIKQMTRGKYGAPGWKVISKHPNKMHAQRMFNTLMINPKNIEL